MPCDRDLGCAGYCIQHSNSAEHPAWLVMRWGTVMRVCWPHDHSKAAALAALTAAYQHLYDLLEPEVERQLTI